MSRTILIFVKFTTTIAAVICSHIDVIYVNLLNHNLPFLGDQITLHIYLLSYMPLACFPNLLLLLNIRNQRIEIFPLTLFFFPIIENLEICIFIFLEIIDFDREREGRCLQLTKATIKTTAQTLLLLAD